MTSFKKHLLPLIFFSVFLVLYSHNLSRATFGGDVGDFLAASLVMGVPHPPGYPLFTFLGFLLSRINLVTPAFMVGLISAFSGALGVVLFFLLSLKFSKNKLISVLSALILGFSYYFWFYSEMAEVFALNNFFALILLFLAFTYSEKKKKKYLYLLSFFVGLSLTNHHTIILIFPSILIICFRNLLKDFRQLKTILVCFLLVILGFLPYVYVPIASYFNPPVNWDNVHDLNSFLHLLLRKDYGTFSIGPIAAPSIEQRLLNLRIYFFNLAAQATLPVIFFVIIGAFYSFKKNLKAFVAILLAFLFSGPVFITYAGFNFLSSFGIGVFERFITLSFVILLMFMPFGFLFLKNILDRILSKQIYSVMIMLTFFIIPLFLFKYNFQKTDLSKVTIGNDVSYDILTPLPKGSLIFLSGDTVLFNTWYVHYGLKYRQDIYLINISNPLSSSFYKKEHDVYIKKHPKEKKDPDLHVKIIAQIAKNHSIYSISPVQPNKGKQLIWIPHGLTYKLYTNNRPSRQEYKDVTEKIWENMRLNISNNLALRSYTTSDALMFYSEALVNTGNYFTSNLNDDQTALKYFQKAIKIHESNFKPYQQIAILYIKENKCDLAKTNLEKSLEISPYERGSYFFLYYTYSQCFNDNKSADTVTKKYKQIFETDLKHDLARMLMYKPK